MRRRYGHRRLTVTKETAPWHITPVRRVSKVTKEEVMSAIRQAFEKCLTAFITAIIVSEAKTKKKLSESEFDDRMNALKLKVSSTKCSKIYIFLNADIIEEYAMYTTLRYMGNRHNVLPQWRMYFEQHFSNFLRDDWQAYQRLAAQFSNTCLLISIPHKQRNLECRWSLFYHLTYRMSTPSRL